MQILHDAEALTISKQYLNAMSKSIGDCQLAIMKNKTINRLKGAWYQSLHTLRPDLPKAIVYKSWVIIADNPCQYLQKLIIQFLIKKTA